MAKNKRLIRVKEVLAMVGISKAELYRRMKLGTCPRNVPLGEKVVGWDEDLIQEWVRARIAEGQKRDQEESVAA